MSRYPIRLLALCGLLLLPGCGFGAMVTAMGYTANSLSYLGSGKGVADHAISAANSEDCALFRIVQGSSVCRDDPSAYRENASALAMISVGSPSEIAGRGGPEATAARAPAAPAPGWTISPAADIWTTTAAGEAAGEAESRALIVAPPRGLRTSSATSAGGVRARPPGT